MYWDGEKLYVEETVTLVWGGGGGGGHALVRNTGERKESTGVGHNKMNKSVLCRWTWGKPFGLEPVMQIRINGSGFVL